MAPSPDLTDLEAKRRALHAELADIGDFRPGSLSAVMRRCGKPNCACADAAHPGHGPQHILTKKIDGKTVSVHFKPGAALDKVTGEVANYKRFKDIVFEIVEVSEAICDTRPASPLPSTSPEPQGPGDAEKRGSSLPSPRSSRRR
jgi:hypothetical protein